MSLGSLVVAFYGADGHAYCAELGRGRAVAIRRDGAVVERGRWSPRGCVVGVSGETPISHEVFAELETNLRRMLADVGEAGQELLDAPAAEGEASHG
ncbi:MAG: hypothetical protein IT372_07885 [Polyangiaceae bacterium]|nr:hypothetical protein [Polyangiaceae bacterium]